MKPKVFFASVFASLSLFVAYHASAAYVVVYPADFGSFNLDIDNDGIPDISKISASSGPSGLLVVNVEIDVPELHQLPGGSNFTRNFASIADMMNADTYSGVAVLTQSAQYDVYTDSSGYISTTISEPVIATWLWGTNGRGLTSADPVLHHLVGWIVDASEYALDVSQPVTIYYNNYGPFPEGHTDTVSLSATGVPEPRGLLITSFLVPYLLCRRRRQDQQHLIR